MFNNIGRKIQGLATFITAVGIGIFSILTIIQVATYSNYGSSEMVVIAVVTGIIGCLLSWLGSFVLYGFGRLIENSQILVSLVSSMKNERNITTHNGADNYERYATSAEPFSQQRKATYEPGVVTENVGFSEVSLKQEAVHPKIRIQRLESDSVCKNCFVPFPEDDNFCAKCGCTEHYIWRDYYGKTCDICKVSGVMVSSAVVEADGTNSIKQVCQKCLSEYVD